MKRILTIITLICMFGGVVYFMFISMKHESVSIIEFVHDELAAEESGNQMTVAEKILMMKSSESVMKGVEHLELDELFEMNKEALVKHIIENVRFHHDLKTGLISVKTYSSSEREAEQMNYAVLKGYITLMIESMPDNRLKGVKEHKESKSMQTARVEKLRNKIQRLSEKNEPSARLLSEVEKSYAKELEILEEIELSEFSEGPNEHYESALIFHKYGWSNATFQK